MDIMELGAIGELMGGVAVIGSLLYVGYQIRQSTITTRVSHQRSSTTAWRAVTAPMHSDADLSALLVHALDDAAPLNREERVRVHYLLLHIVNFFQDQLEAWEAGILDTETMEAWEVYIASILAKPGGRTWWHSARSLYPGRVGTRLSRAMDGAAPYDDLPFLNPSSEQA